MNDKEKSNQAKIAALQSSGTLNPAAETVKDPAFQNQSFFDSRDIVQVRYELLRRVQVEKASISDAAKSFGFSRLSYYRILALFEESGLCGLVPKKRGPKQAHKLTEEIVEFMFTQIRNNHSVNILDLKAAIEKTFVLSVHTRSIERALAKKKGKSHE